MSLIERLILVAIALVAYGCVCWYCRWRYLQEQSFVHARLDNDTQAEVTEKSVFLVAYASQSGTAAAIAKRSAASLAGHVPYQLLPLNKVNAAVLQSAKQALFVVSTYGEGEPPDNGAAFATRYLKQAGAIDLAHLQFSVLALGDKLYQQFCEFGHQLHRGLCQLGAIPLFDPMEACATEGFNQDLLINQWRTQLGLFEFEEQSDGQINALWQDAELEQWQLTSRICVNPHSPGAPAYHLRLSHADISSKPWQAGDIVEIVIPDEVAAAHHEPQSQPVKRKYSIASIPEDGSIDLLVRQHQGEDGKLGVGSGWLTTGAPLNADMQLQRCDNPAFHAVDAKQPMILIGSGTGIAGLRSHLKARALQSCSQNWLLFGERSPEYDRFFADDIAAWQQKGVINRVDLAFSRQQPAQYVQDCLLAAAEQVRQWVASGAAIYVCGNRTGMAQGVDQALQDILGQAGYDKLMDNDCYRRDVY